MRRRIATIGIAALALGGVAVTEPAVAHGGGRRHDQRAKAGARTAKAEQQRFVVVGRLVAVDPGARVLLVKVSGGNVPVARGTEIDVDVSDDASIRRNGRLVDVAQLRAGDRLMAKGTAGTASKVIARGHRAPTTSTTTSSTPTATSTTSTSTTSTTSTSTTSTTSTTTV